MLKKMLTVVAAALLLCSQSNAETVRKLKQFGKHVWSYENVKPMKPANSFGANAGIVVGKNGVMVIDTLVSAKEGKQLLADIREITSLPILFVVNTHYHLDHSWGNCAFADENAVIIAAEPGRNLLKTSSKAGLEKPEQYGLTKDDVKGTVLTPATITFKGEMTIDLGGVVVDLKQLPHGHCQDNLIAWIEADKVLFAGDLMFVECHPFMGEGNIGDWVKNLDELAVYKAKTIIPGHGRLSSQKDIVEMKAYLQTFDAAAKALCNGKTQNDAPELAKKLFIKLPKQNRHDLGNMVEFNLRLKYLPPAKK